MITTAERSSLKPMITKLLISGVLNEESQNSEKWFKISTFAIATSVTHFAGICVCSVKAKKRNKNVNKS